MNHLIYQIVSVECVLPYSLRLRFNGGLVRTVDLEQFSRGSFMVPSATRRFLGKSPSTQRFTRLSSGGRALEPLPCSLLFKAIATARFLQRGRSFWQYRQGTRACLRMSTAGSSHPFDFAGAGKKQNIGA